MSFSSKRHGHELQTLFSAQTTRVKLVIEKE